MLVGLSIKHRYSYNVPASINHDKTQQTTNKRASHSLPLFWTTFIWASHVCFLISCLSYDVASGSEITSCNEIDKPLVVYRFSGNVMASITTLRTQRQHYHVFTQEMRFKVIFM